MSSWRRNRHDNCEVRTHEGRTLYRCQLTLGGAGESTAVWLQPARLLRRRAGLRWQNVLRQNSVWHLCTQPWPAQHQTVCRSTHHVLRGCLSMRLRWTILSSCYSRSNLLVANCFINVVMLTLRTKTMWYFAHQLGLNMGYEIQHCIHCQSKTDTAYVAQKKNIRIWRVKSSL